MKQKATLIPIDLSSIKEVIEKAKTTIKIKSREPIIDIEGIYLVSFGENRYVYEGFYYGDIPGKISNLFDSNNVSVSISVERKGYSHKDPDTNVKYSYRHKDIEIKCNHCNAIFLTSELINDEIYDEEEDDYLYVINRCPKCEQDKCVKLEFQTMTDCEINKLLSK